VKLFSVPKAHEGLNAMLNGKIALITGSTDGMGRPVAESLGETGVHVLVHGRNRDRGEQTVSAIKESGSTAEFLAANFSEPSNVRELAGLVQRKAERLDILINNAGIGTGGSGCSRQTSAVGRWRRS
jgi:NAD(P)-dependent dehydrogenase (short-subunit alcohol dehydrogenase family)